MVSRSILKVSVGLGVAAALVGVVLGVRGGSWYVVAAGCAVAAGALAQLAGPEPSRSRRLYRLAVALLVVAVAGCLGTVATESDRIVTVLTIVIVAGAAATMIAIGRMRAGRAHEPAPEQA